MKFGEYWDKEMRKNDLNNLKAMEFIIHKSDIKDKTIFNQLKSFLNMFSDINVDNENQFSYYEEYDKFIIRINKEYILLEKVIKEYLNLLEENDLLEWV